MTIKVFGTMAYPASGSFAEYAKARTDCIYRKPKNLTHAEASVLPLVGEMLCTVRRLDPVTQ